MEVVPCPPHKEDPKVHGGRVVLALELYGALDFAHAHSPKGDIRSLVSEGDASTGQVSPSVGPVDLWCTQCWDRWGIFDRGSCKLGPKLLDFSSLGLQPLFWGSLVWLSIVNFLLMLGMRGLTVHGGHTHTKTRTESCLRCRCKQKLK